MSISLNAPAISLDMLDGMLVAGCKNGAIEVMEAKDKAEPRTVMLKHSEGEVWGLTNFTMPDDPTQVRFVSSCDDNRIIAYNATKHKALCEGVVDVPKKGKKSKKKKERKGGASSMSN